MTAVLEADGLGKRTAAGGRSRDCTLVDPQRTRRRPGRPERRRQDHAAQPRGRAAGADRRVDRGPRRAPGGQPGAARPGRLRRAGHPDLRALSIADHLRLGAQLNPGWDADRRPTPDRAARPRPEAEGRQALRRPARAAGADPGDRQAARAADPRRAGRQPRPAGPARVPAAPDGGRRRARAQRRAVLAPGRRPGAGLRLPRRARRLAGAGRRRRRRAAGVAPPAHRRAPRPGDAARGPARHRGQPHRPAEHAARPHRRARSSTRPGPSSRSAWKTSCSPTWAKPVIGSAGAAGRGWGSCDDLAQLAAVPRPGLRRPRPARRRRGRLRHHRTRPGALLLDRRRHLRSPAATATSSPAFLLDKHRLLQHLELRRRSWSRRSSGSSGARRWSPASWRPARSGWPGRRASPAPAGWPSSSAVVGLASVAPPGCSA